MLHATGDSTPGGGCQHHASTMPAPWLHRASTMPAPWLHRASTMAAPCQHHASTMAAPCQHHGCTGQHAKCCHDAANVLAWCCHTAAPRLFLRPVVAVGRGQRASLAFARHPQGRAFNAAATAGRRHGAEDGSMNGLSTIKCSLAVAHLVPYRWLRKAREGRRHVASRAWPMPTRHH